MFEKSVWRKLRNWLVSEYIRLKLWIGEKRSQLSPLKKKNFWFTIIKSRVFRVILVFLLFSCPLTIAFLSSVVHINPLTDVKNYWEEILKVLKYHPAITTIALAIASLPVAFTLWLFRNHDIVMNLDLDMYHEAVKNIHDEKASVGLRQVAFTTLLELKEKWMWKDKIMKQVFPGANLKRLALQDVNLQGVNLEGANLESANLHDSNLQGAILWHTNLQGAILINAKLQSAFLLGANLQGAILINAKLQGSNIANVNLTDTYLFNADLQGSNLIIAYYYKNKKAEKNNKSTLVTKKWLKKQNALHVDTVMYIPEK